MNSNFDINVGLEAKVLSQLFSAQIILHAFPDETKMGDFITQALISIPGIEVCFFCSRNSDCKPSKPTQEIIPILEHIKNIRDAQDQFYISKPFNENLILFPLQTINRTHGYICIFIKNTEYFKKFRSPIHNFINVVALDIENRWQKKQLIQHKFHLEELVEKRTAELQKEIIEHMQAEKKLQEQNIEYEILNRNYLRQNIDLATAKGKAEESDRFKSAFLTNMSHEIRTPMNGILGFADLLKEPNLTGKEQKEYIEIIEKSGQRMLNIINNIVDISKIEAGLMTVDITEVNVNEKIKYIFTFFKPQAEEKHIDLRIQNTILNNEILLETDREKLLAILTNLVKNAIKFTDSGSVEFGYVVKSESTPPELEFFVKDTGIGIPKNKLEDIYKRFNQADIENRMARQGSGLGLTISKSYVEMLGGRIWAESEEGIGSTLYFTLPYLHKQSEVIMPQNVVQKQSAINNTNNRIKILVAEDDEESATLLGIYLKPFTEDLFFAENGADAVEIILKNIEIDLILMDIQMPVMGGFSATKKIREFNKDVIIIAQTAFGLSEDRQKAIDAGCNDYLSKPIKINLLYEMINQYFSSG